jgi:hypothetical protein
MNDHVQDNKLSVIKMTQNLLQRVASSTDITPSLIRIEIDKVLSICPEWSQDLDYDEVINELTRRFSERTSHSSTIQNSEGHLDWLTSARKENWRYWLRYQQWQENTLSNSALTELDASTDKILGLLEDPKRSGAWDRRGLVVGHVQSGKTGNYTGLITKAADAGYKIIIVLAGMHNNLRSQTQIRLEEGFLGYNTFSETEDLTPIGVGLIDSDNSIRPNNATTRLNNGDFDKKTARHLGITPEERPWIFVVKKNKTVLERLLFWVNNRVADSQEAGTGKKIVTKLPLLMIDDEADNASVDTGEQYFTEEGEPDDEHEPKTINRLIRRILHAFEKKSYVGYTATPFANIFIHEKSATAAEGDDLFPSAFIESLGASSNYIGPRKMFGVNGIDGREGGLPLIHTVKDNCDKSRKSGWMPEKHKNGYVPTHNNEYDMPESLIEAVDSFFIACALRELRGQGDKHSSMLVHVTRFKNVQGVVSSQVERYKQSVSQRLKRKIGHEDFVKRLKFLWENNFKVVTKKLAEEIPELVSEDDFSWGAIENIILNVINDIQVKTINGTAKDVLDYENEVGVKVIAIGGDKLSRGLTLEGLCVSYFLRSSKMYDTLMQMGRWFGYRQGYLDLCRLYTTSDLIEWFEHIADASEELREEFEIMAESGATPMEFGLKVQSHPVLMVTSKVKMQQAKTLLLSFSGSIIETVSLHRDRSVLKRNYLAYKSMIERIGVPSDIPSQIHNNTRKNWNGAFWENISHNIVTDFLGGYVTTPESLKANSLILQEFIEVMASANELTNWSIAVIGGGEKEFDTVAGNKNINWAKRVSKKSGQPGSNYTIGRLLQSWDESIGMSTAEMDAAFKETQRVYDPSTSRAKAPPTTANGPSIRKIRGLGAEGILAKPENGLLMIYLLNPEYAELDGCEEPIVAFGISFPGSKSGKKVEYKVNNVLWNNEYA